MLDKTGLKKKKKTPNKLYFLDYLSRKIPCNMDHSDKFSKIFKFRHSYIVEVITIDISRQVVPCYRTTIS